MRLSADDPASRQELYIEVTARRYNKGAVETRAVALAKEVPYTVFLNDREILSIATLPVNLKELFVGFMVSEGVLLDPDEVLECKVDHGSRIVIMEVDVPAARIAKVEKKGMLTSGCAGGVIFSVETASAPVADAKEKIEISAETVLKRMQDLDTYSGMYSITRGTHAASIATGSETLAIMEDLGRHNAVDKIVGYCFLNRISPRDKLLLTTGRITSEVLIKAARSGFPMIISRSSASALAVNMAVNSKIDVITYVRAGRFNYFGNGAVELV
jgi:FdhD protein